MTIAAVGDLVTGRAITGSDMDAEFETIVRVVRDANVAIADLEMNLLGDDEAAAARRGQGPRWTFGSAREASALKTLGFDVVGHANNHATDYGADGMNDTRAILTASGLTPAGAGRISTKRERPSSAPALGRSRCSLLRFPRRPRRWRYDRTRTAKDGQVSTS